MMAGPVQFNTPPPPIMPNLSVPPPMGPPPTNVSSTSHQQYFHPYNRGGHRNFFQPFRPYPRPGPPGAAGLDEFDGKRLRKSVMRKTVDYNAAIIKMLEARVWQRDFRDRRALQPDVLFYPNLEPPSSYIDNAINSVVTRFVKTATNKMRCPIFCMAWTPEGRRLVTGASSGEFTLWNGLTFNFETILQAHDSPVRTMVWSHNDVWMVTGDHAGYVKYWQSNMNNVKMFQAHKEAIRGLSFSPTDQKFVTCSDDGTLRIWDFGRCFEEKILRGHGADVKCVHWHPQKSLIISGSKDNQQPVKLWDPKSGSSMATLHAHKSTVMDIKWNENGNWLVTASRDHLLKLFDIRNLSQEVQIFRGHKKEASSVAWHPFHEGLFCSGGSDGAILFWHVGADKEVGGIEQAHDSIVWTLAWHPLGHILCSGSNDHTSKFWTRNRPGDQMRDKYNLNTLPAGLAGTEDVDIDDTGIIPGMGPEDRVEQIDLSPSTTPATIPGLDFEGVEDKSKPFQKKVPYSKPIPRNFVAQWNETVAEDQSGGEEEDSHTTQVDPAFAKMLATLLEKTTVQGCIPVSEITPQAIIVYGKLLPVEEGDVFSKAITAGSEALHELILSGTLEELDDVRPYLDDRPEHDCSDNMEVDHMPDIEYPPPLPSSIFAKKGGPVAQPLRKTRFSDAEPGQVPPVNVDPGAMGDKDMRSMGGFLPSFPFPSGDQDLRVDPSFIQNQHDEDLRILRDIDLREAMMNKQQLDPRAQLESFSGMPDGPFGLPRMGENEMGSQDVDARHLPFSSEQGNWQFPPPLQQHQQQQHWNPADSVNNFNARNFVATNNYQSKSDDYTESSKDSPSSNYGNGMGGPNAYISNYPNSNQGGLRRSDDKFDEGWGGGYRLNEGKFDDKWAGQSSQGSPMDRSQMGQRPLLRPGQHMGLGPVDHRLTMGPRQMGPNGPHIGLRPMDPNQQMSTRPPLVPGGLQMSQRPPLGPGGQQMGPRGPLMGPRGQMGPGGHSVDHRRSQDPRNPQSNHGATQSQQSPSDNPMDGRSTHLGQDLSQNIANQQMGLRPPHMGAQDQQGSPNVGHRGGHRDPNYSIVSPDLHRDQGGHLSSGDNHRELGTGPPLGIQRDHWPPQGPGESHRDSGGPPRERHLLGPGGTHNDPRHPIGAGSNLGDRDQRHMLGPGGSHGDTVGPQRGHLLGPGGTHTNVGPQREQRHLLGPGGVHSDPRDSRHHAGPGDRGRGAPHRDRDHRHPGHGDSYNRDLEGGRGRDSHRDRHQGAPGEMYRDPENSHSGSPSHRDVVGHGGPSGHQMDSNHAMGSQGNQRGPGLHMGPSSKQMESKQQYGLESAEVDAGQEFDEEEMHPGPGVGRPQYFRGRGFPRGRGPRMRLRGSRGHMRGGWRGVSS